MSDTEFSSGLDGLEALLQEKATLLVSELEQGNLGRLLSSSMTCSRLNIKPFITK